MTSTWKSRGRRRAVTVALACCALAVSACGGGTGSDNGNDTDTDTGDGAPEAPAQQGGSVTFVSAGPIASWDPTVAVLPTIPGIGTDRMLAVYGALLYVDMEDTVQGSIAESLTSDDDFVNWTLTLNPGVAFSDGTPLDAEAVKYNWDRAAGPDSAIAEVAGQISSEVADETTLEITLDEPNPVFDRNVAESLTFIASPTALEEQGDSYVDPVGAGPFLLEEWDQAIGETFTRNPDYFIDGKPHLDELRFQIVADPAQRVSTVVQGGAEIMNNYRFALLEVLENPGVDTYPVESGGIRHFVFNLEQEPFSDPRARQAAALAIDADELTQTLTQDPEDGGWASLFPEASPLRDPAHDIAHNDPDAATALVDELEADGVDVSFRIVAAAVPEIIRAAELLQIQLNAVGFDATIDQVELGDWADVARVQYNFGLTFYPGVFDLNNAPVAFSDWFDGGENVARYESDEMAEALAAARTATTDEELTEAFSAIQEIYARDLPFVVFGIDERVFFHRDSVAGFTPIGRGMLLSEDLYRTDL